MVVQIYVHRFSAKLHVSTCTRLTNVFTYMEMDTNYCHLDITMGGRLLHNTVQLYTYHTCTQGSTCLPQVSLRYYHKVHGHTHIRYVHVCSSLLIIEVGDFNSFLFEVLLAWSPPVLHWWWLLELLL